MLRTESFQHPLDITRHSANYAVIKSDVGLVPYWRLFRTENARNEGTRKQICPSEDVQSCEIKSIVRKLREAVRSRL